MASRPDPAALPATGRSFSAHDLILSSLINIRYSLIITSFVSITGTWLDSTQSSHRLEADSTLEELGWPQQSQADEVSEGVIEGFLSNHILTLLPQRLSHQARR